MTMAPPGPPAPLGTPGPVSRVGAPATRRPGARPPARQSLNPADLFWRWLAGNKKPAPTGPDAPSPNVALAITSLTILAAILLSFLAQVTVLGTLKHNRDQQVAYDDLRLSLAEGTTPVGPVETTDLDANGTAIRGPIPVRSPLAQMSIPAIGVKEIVLEGTSSSVLRSGIGHRRDTVLPGQAGTSILMGRRLVYGAPFGSLGDLNEGDPITVLTGQGTAQFLVVAVRRAGDIQPNALPAGGSRITLVTSAGSRFAPDGVLIVDADMTTAAFPAATPPFSSRTLPREEGPMATEPGALKGAVGWGLLLTAGAIGVTWLRIRWGRWQGWLVGVPVLALLGTATADHAMRLLPNLL